MKPIRAPNEEERRNVLEIALEMLIVIFLSNHVYKFNNEVRKQSDLTGEASECFMINWDLKFLEKLKLLGIVPEIYSRFKDDITFVTLSIEKGTVFKNGKLLVEDNQKVIDQDKSDEEVTIEILKNIGESIDDTYKTRKVPILHVQVCITGE